MLWMNRTQYDISLLTRSYTRLQILELLKSRTIQIYEMEKELGIARTTLKGNLNKLKERRWIEKSKDGYKITPTGHVIVREFLSFQNRLKKATNTVEEINPFIRWIGDLDSLNLVALNGSQISTPKPGNPHAPIQRFMTIIENAECIRGFSSVVMPIYVKTFHRCITEDNMRAEIILQNEVAGALKRRYQQEWQETLETQRCNTLIYKGNLPFGLALADDNLIMIAYDSEGFPRALLENTSSEALSWAKQLYESYRKKAKPFKL